MIGEHVVPGVTTEELDRICHDYIVNVQRSMPANVNYRGFPKTICTSVNHVVCHGIPNDQAPEGRRHRQHRRHRHQGRLSRRHQPHVLRRQARRARPAPGGHLLRCDVARHRGACARARTWAISGMRSRASPRNDDFSVVREYCGHGIGRVYHEDPQVLHYGEPGTGLELQARHDLYHRADGQCRQAARAAAARWLDGRHQGSLALGAVGAHGARHRQRSSMSHARRGRAIALTYAARWLPKTRSSSRKHRSPGRRSPGRCSRACRRCWPSSTQRGRLARTSAVRPTRN